MITLYASGQIAGELLLSIFADKLPCHKLYIIAIASLLGGVATIPIMFVSSVALLKAISTGRSFSELKSVAMVRVTSDLGLPTRRASRGRC